MNVEKLTSSTQQCISIDIPIIRLPVVGDGLDQIAVRGTHTNPKGGISRRSTRCLGKDESRNCLPDERVVRNRSSAESRAHGSVRRPDGYGSHNWKDLSKRGHGAGMKK